jgi:divalent metal cation (Fe/Co/Zn/Cd) transporter
MILGEETAHIATVHTTSDVVVRDATWHRAAWFAYWLAWASLAWMTVEGGLGLAAGLMAGSIALVGWALGSAVEGLGSLVVVWRFSGRRALSERAERLAQRAIAVSFWLLAPYIAAEAIDTLVKGDHPESSNLGIALAAVALVVMPLLGGAKHRLGTRLGSMATAGEGTQNYLCAAQAAGVLLSLVVVAAWPGGWWIDPTVALGIAGLATYEGFAAWRGDECSC